MSPKMVEERMDGADDCHDYNGEGKHFNTKVVFLTFFLQELDLKVVGECSLLSDK